LQTFLRRKNFPRPPGPPDGRPPGPPEDGRPPERGGPEPGPDSACGAAPVSGALPGVSSGMMFPLHSSCSRWVRRRTRDTGFGRSGFFQMKDRQRRFLIDGFRRLPEPALQLQREQAPGRPPGLAPRAPCLPCGGFRAVPLLWRDAFLPRRCVR